jgi:hypothetical protein
MTTARDKIAEIIDEMVRYDGFMGAWDAHDAADEILAALPDTIAPLVWEPIETAPKDGTCILISNGKDGIFSGMYVGYWYQEGGWKFSIKNRIPDATHWMPLPASPTGEKP